MMIKQNKTRLYIKDLLKEPAIAYPAYYSVSVNLSKNDNFLDALIALHSFEFEHYSTPKSFDEIFKSYQHIIL